MLADAPFFLPHEDPQDFSALQAAWTREIPGTSFTVQTLRDDLIRADWQRRCARSVFDQLQLDLHFTGLPVSYWDRLTRQQFRFVEKHVASTQQEFRKALQLAHSFKPAPVKPEPPLPEPPKPKGDYGAVFPQCIMVSVVDGKAVTKVNEYAHLTQHNDDRTEDYQEFCEREIAIDGPHLLDGQRWGDQHWLNYK